MIARLLPRLSSRLWAAPFAALALAAAPVDDARADSSAAGAAPHLAPDEAAAFSKEIERTLAEDGARLAIVFRTGRTRDRLPDGIEYTHGGFWVYRDIVLEDGETERGYAVYNLYHGDGETLPRTQSYLAQDWPLDFTRGSAVDDVAVIIPSPEMQRRILEILDSPLYERLHNPSYSLIANPHRDVHQNCTTFMLAVVAAAAWETDDRDQIAANLAAHFEPQEVKAGLLGRLFGPIADERLRLDDQSGALKTATFRSMERFMANYGLLKESYVVTRRIES